MFTRCRHLKQATEAFVDELSDHAAAHLLDLILKKRAELDSGAEGDINIFETGETRIRLEDYEKLDANGDGLISRYCLSALPHPLVSAGTDRCGARHDVGNR